MAQQAAEAELEHALTTLELLLPAQPRAKQQDALARVTAAAQGSASGQQKSPAAKFFADAPDEVVLDLAFAVDDAADLLRLAVACTRLRSMVSEIVRLWLAERTDAELAWAPPRAAAVDCWQLGRMQELQRLQLPLAFADPGSTKLWCWDPGGRPRSRKREPSAAGLKGVGLGICSGAPMRAGVHEAHIKVHSLVGNGHGSDPDYSNWSAVGCVSAARPRPTDMDIDDGCKESIGRTEHGWAWDACGTLHVMSHLFNLVTTNVASWPGDLFADGLLWHDAGKREHGEPWGEDQNGIPWCEGDVLQLLLNLGDGKKVGTLSARKEGGTWAVLASNIPPGAFYWAVSLWKTAGGDEVSIVRA
jgi:hypothetical protein